MNTNTYQELIKTVLRKTGHPRYDPRWIEAYMRLEHPTLNGLSFDAFVKDALICIEVVKEAGKKEAEACAKSFGL